MHVSILRASFLSFSFFFFFHFGLCVCVCVCVYVLMKNIFLVIHYSAHPMVFFHSFYMFDILAKPVRRGVKSENYNI